MEPDATDLRRSTPRTGPSLSAHSSAARAAAPGAGPSAELLHASWGRCAPGRAARVGLPCRFSVSLWRRWSGACRLVALNHLGATPLVGRGGGATRPVRMRGARPRARPRTSLRARSWVVAPASRVRRGTRRVKVTGGRWALRKRRGAGFGRPLVSAAARRPGVRALGAARPLRWDGCGGCRHRSPSVRASSGASGPRHPPVARWEPGRGGGRGRAAPLGALRGAAATRGGTDCRAAGWEL